MLSLLRAQGVASVLEDSSGNGGAAVAAYAAAGGHGGDHPGAGLDEPGQDGADARAWRRGGAGARHPPGHGRSSDPPRRRDLLRQPQLASVLPAGHQDAGLRAVGGPWLPGARQRHRAVRRRIERARAARSASPSCCARARSTPLPRLFAAQPANCAPDRRRRSLPASRSRPRSPDDRRGHRHRPADPAARGARRAATHARRRRHAERSRDRRRDARPRAASASMSSRPRRRWRRPSPSCWRPAPSRPEQTTVLVLTGSGLKATPRIAELLGVTL